MTNVHSKIEHKSSNNQPSKKVSVRKLARSSYKCLVTTSPDNAWALSVYICKDIWMDEPHNTSSY